MFNNENTGELQNMDISKISEDPEKVRNIMLNRIENEAFCPIIFLGDKQLQSAPPITDSLRTLATWNTLVNTTEYIKCIAPIKSIDKLHILATTDADTTSELVRQKILSDVFANFTAALDRNEYNKDLLHYFYLRETVYNYLYDSNMSAFANNIKCIIYDSIYSFSTYNVYSNALLEEQKAYLVNMAGLLSSTIISAINCAIENAINDILYRVHTNPNINDIERKLRYAFNLKMSVEEGFWVYAADKLKNSILYDMGDCYNTISGLCKDNIFDILYTNCYVYNDALKNRKHELKNNLKPQ